MANKVRKYQSGNEMFEYQSDYLRSLYGGLGQQRPYHTLALSHN